jgi:hypothetical protein
MTAQVPEELIIDGESWLLLATPLDAVLTRRPVPPNTALGRGYVGSWRVDGADLFLDDVTGWVADGDQRPVEVGPGVLLPGWKLPVRATWVSGELRIASGDQVVHVRRGFASEWEYEGTLHVEDGVVTRRNVPAQRSPTRTERSPVDVHRVAEVAPEVRPPLGEPAQQLHPDGRAERPWFCMYCGWRCDQFFNDYKCHACNENRPWIGGSMTMRQCGTCRHLVPAFARFCEWCGTALAPIDY